MSFQDDDKLSWDHERESFFINLLVDEVGKGNLTSLTFHNRTWTQIEAHMHAKYSKAYPTSKLKQKFQKLKAKWKTFRELKGNTSFGWDDVLQTVTASDRIWKEEIVKNKDVAQFRKKGCDHFDKLTEIFGDFTVIEDLARASTQGSLNSDEEQEVEEVYIHSSNSSNQDISMNDSEDAGESKSLSSSRKDKKRVNNSAFISLASSNVVDEAWMAFKNAQESKKAMLDRIEGEVKARDCILIIEVMNDIPEDQFVKACVEFKNSSMRDMFVAMTDTRRRQWLRSLTR